MSGVRPVVYHNLTTTPAHIPPSRTCRTSMRIVLFDIPRKEGPRGRFRSFSPNTFKTRRVSRPGLWKFGDVLNQPLRFALQYKGIPFSTEWIEFPDIEPKLKAYGVPPNDPSLAAMPYTLPALAIYEANPDGKEELKEVIMESSRIAAFLDDRYQSRKLIRGSPASQEAQREFIKMINTILYPSLLPLFALSVVAHLSSQSAKYYRSKREARFGCKLEDLVASTEIIGKQWAAMDAAFDRLAAFLDESAAEGEAVLEVAETDNIGGQTTKTEPTYAALILAATFVAIEEVAVPGTWERIRMRNGGRWRGVRASCEPYAYRTHSRIYMATL